MATAIMDAAAARRDYLDETGGRYVHLIAYGDLATGGDIAKALACGADAVMLGHALAPAAEAPGQGRFWDATASHPRVPRSAVLTVSDDKDERAARRSKRCCAARPPMPAASGTCSASLRRVMGKCGYSSLKEFQKAGLILHSGR